MALQHSRPDLFRGEDTPVGVFVLELFSPNLWRMLTLGRLDFGIVDLEHSRFTATDVATLAAAAQETCVPLLVRVPVLDPAAIGRVLDLGAAGVMVSRIETESDAQTLVRSVKFAPEGMRNAAFGVAYDHYQSDDWGATAAWANERTICIPLIETAEAVRNIEAICAVPGLDAIWLGPADLTQSLGALGQLSSREYVQAEERVLAAASEHGLRVGIWARTSDEVQRQLERGYGAVAVGTDSGIMIRALQSHVDRVREIARAVPAAGG